MVCTVLGLPGLATTGAAAASAAPTGAVFVAQQGTNTGCGNGGGTGTSAQALGTVTAYPLSAAGDVAPRVILAKDMDGPIALAFDSSGDLWAANSVNDTVLEFTKGELAQARPVPSVTISSDSSGPLNQPGVPVFAPSGALWVANATNNTVVEYTRSELTKSGSPAPYVTISANASLSNINGPYGLAFDPAGDMWVANASTVVEFNKAQLTRSGSPAPIRTIAGRKTGLDCPTSIVVWP